MIHFDIRKYQVNFAYWSRQSGAFDELKMYDLYHFLEIWNRESYLKEPCLRQNLHWFAPAEEMVSFTFMQPYECWRSLNKEMSALTCK